MNMKNIFIIALCFIAVSNETLADITDILPTRIEVAQDAENQPGLGINSLLEFSYMHGRDPAWKKVLMQFDISPISSQVTVISASMYLCSRNGGKINVYPLLVDWDEQEVSNVNRKTGVPWASQYIESSTGVDFDGTPVASGVQLVFHQHVAIDVTELVQDWIDGTLENNGVLINYYNEHSGGDIYSKEKEEVQYHPYLQIQYEPLYESRIGDYPQNNTAFLISADYLSGEVRGDVSSASVGDASPFATNKLEWMLGYLATREDVVITNPSTIRGNLIQPADNVTVPLILKATDSLIDILQGRNEDGSSAFRLAHNGYFSNYGYIPAYSGDFAGGIRIRAVTGDGDNGVIQFDGLRFKGWANGAWQYLDATSTIQSGTAGYVMAVTETLSSSYVPFMVDDTTIRGATEITWDNTQKKLTIIGTLYASTLQGDGSYITNIEWGHLTGDADDAIAAGDNLYWIGNTLYANNASFSTITGLPSDAITAGNYIDWSGDALNVTDSWYDSIFDLPTGSISDGDTSHIANNDQIHDFVTGLGYITDPNDSVSGSELDGVFSTSGLLKRTGAGTYSTITDNSFNWDASYAHVGVTTNPHSTSYGNLAGSPSDDITAGDFINWSGDALNVTDSWYDSIIDLPTSSVQDGDTTHIATCDSIYDFVMSFGFIQDGNTNWDNQYGFITDGNYGWDNSYGFITDPNDDVSGSELDGVFSTTGILKRTGAGAYSTISDNSTNWNAAYSDRLKWDGGETGLNASTGRTSLGLGSSATRNAEDALTNGSNLPDGAAVKTFVEGKGYTTASETIDYVTDVFASLGTAAYRTATGTLVSNEYLPTGAAVMTYLVSSAYIRNGLNYSGTGYYGLFADKTGDNRLRFRSLKNTDGSIDFGSSTDSLDISLDSTLKSHYDSAYGWGNHASAGYLKANGSVTATGILNMGTHGIVGIDQVSAASVLASGEIRAYGRVRADDTFSANGYTGVSGSFTTADGKTVTVRGGIITAITGP